MLNLTIAIPTVVGRERIFGELQGFLLRQIELAGLDGKVEIIFLRDNKEMSIGLKRRKLYELAKGKFCVQIDDDDTVHTDYVRMVNDVIEKYSDIQGIGYIEHCTIEGRVLLAHHSDRWPDWGENGIVDGMRFDYVRTLFFKDPILSDICRGIPVADLRYGEDHDFARRLKASGLVKHCAEIPLPMYFYRFNPEPFEKKYGFER